MPVFSRPQAKDDNHNVIQGGTSLEFQVLTCTASNMLAMNFSETPKAVIFQTRTGATDVEFVMGTSTTGNGANGAYWTIRAGTEFSLDCASTGTFYFRNSATNQVSVVIGVALL